MSVATTVTRRNRTMKKISCDLISSEAYLCGESPMWDAEHQEFWWTDMLAGRVFRYRPRNGSATCMAEGIHVSGFSMKQGGGMVCASHQGVFVWDEQNGYRLLADTCNGHVLHCNDATADARGRFLFGTTFYGPDSRAGNYPLGKLFVMDNDGSLRVLDEGIHLSNGLGFSPDQRTLYYTDTAIRTIYAFDYNVEQGTVANRRIFVRVPDQEGIPDGLTVDADGYVWSAQWYGGCIVRYAPDGRIDRRIVTPAKQTSSLVFGGDDFMDIYVTTAAQSIALECAPEGCGVDAAEGVGGPVYRYRLGVKGSPEHVVDLRLQYNS